MRESVIGERQMRIVGHLFPFITLIVEWPGHEDLGRDDAETFV
jgi:hypothetical protein